MGEVDVDRSPHGEELMMRTRAWRGDACCCAALFALSCAVLSDRWSLKDSPPRSSVGQWVRCDERATVPLSVAPVVAACRLRLRALPFLSLSLLFLLTRTPLVGASARKMNFSQSIVQREMGRRNHPVASCSGLGVQREREREREREKEQRVCERRGARAGAPARREARQHQPHWTTESGSVRSSLCVAVAPRSTLLLVTRLCVTSTCD